MIEGVFSKRTLRDAKVEPGQTALARVDFNVPLERGHVADDTRIRAALPAIELLRERGARLVLCSHLGRPKGRDPDTSLAPASECLRELLGGGVYQAPEVIGPEVRRGVSRLEPEEVLVLENTRWEPGETRNDPELAREMAEPADLFVNDAFGAAHRTHASTVGVTRYLPAVAGPLLEREVRTLSAVIESPERPLVVILGGAKVSGKIELIDRFLDLADVLLIGGAMCFSFFRAQGLATGNSLVEAEDVEPAPPRGARSTTRPCRRAGWASTSGRARARYSRARSWRRGRCSGTARWGSSSSSRSRPGRARSPRRSPPRTA